MFYTSDASWLTLFKSVRILLSHVRHILHTFPIYIRVFCRNHWNMLSWTWHWFLLYEYLWSNRLESNLQQGKL
jgi:hypothetical protein